jgi:hypothetical protein
MNTTDVYDTYWRFAAERHAMFERRLSDPIGPWTEDRILQTYRFTNVYRVLDRVSQYLVREVQYRPGPSQAPAEVFFRTMLFKLFNKIETWELLEDSLGPVSWQSFDFDAASAVLGRAMSEGQRVYSAAYIMPAPALGHERKHDNHLALLSLMMQDGLPARIQRAGSLREVFELILTYPGLGKFLAFQYAIDLNYSSMLDFSEGDFVVAGPGALDGISKCFAGSENSDPARIILDMVDRQTAEFARLGLSFSGLFGRPLQPIDCQNIFCEISKYARVAHPQMKGISGRTRIKQSFRQSPRSVCSPMLPPKWGLREPTFTEIRGRERQADLFRISA